jgi:hypothetical protein
MADFDRWGFAIGEALGRGLGEEFLKAYQKNVERQNEEVIQGNTLAQALLRLMTDYPMEEWEGTVGDLFKVLTEISPPVKDDDTFPKVQRTLKKHIERITPTLLDHGLKFTFHPKKTREGYKITIHRDGKFGSFDSQRVSPPDNHTESDENSCEPNGEPSVNQNENQEFGSPLSSPSNISESLRCEPNEPSEPKFHPSRGDVVKNDSEIEFPTGE